MPVKDTYDCYTLDTDTLTYTGISLPGSNAPGGRCGHSGNRKTNNEEIDANIHYICIVCLQL